MGIAVWVSFGVPMKTKWVLLAAFLWGAVCCAGYVRANTNLTPSASSTMIGTTSPTAGVSLDMGSVTDSMLIPKGTTAQRPVTGVAGMVRYNTDTSAFELYAGSTWIVLPNTVQSQSSATHSIVTATNQTGFQVSSTRNALVNYSVLITTTATIAGGAAGSVFLEIAATNSVTPSDWTSISQITNGQTLSLALTLQSVQPIALGVFGFVPAGYYVRLRSANTTGTPAYAYQSGQEVLL